MFIISEENTSINTFYDKLKDTHNNSYKYESKPIVDNDTYTNSNYKSSKWHSRYYEEGDNEVVESNEDKKAKDTALEEAAMYAYEEECRAYEQQYREYNAYMYRKNMMRSQAASMNSNRGSHIQTGYYQAAYPQNTSRGRYNKRNKNSNKK